MTKDAKQSVMGMMRIPWIHKALSKDLPPPLALVPDIPPVQTPLMSKPNTWYVTSTGMDTNTSAGKTSARVAFKNSMPTEINGGELIELVPRTLLDKAIQGIRQMGSHHDDPRAADLIHSLGELP